jgi:hypothetical protein
LSKQRFDARRIVVTKEEQTRYGEVIADVVAHLNAGLQFRVTHPWGSMLNDEVLSFDHLHRLTVEVAVPQGRDESEWKYINIPFPIFLQAAGKTYSGYEGREKPT